MSRVLIILLALGWWGPFLRAEPVISTVTNTYEVTGSSPREMRHSMERNRPTDGSGRRFDAYTKWDLKWTYRWKNVPGGVQIEKVQVKAFITYIMPLWQPPKDAAKELVARWQTFLRALSLHEKGHANLSLLAAKEVEKELNALPVQTSGDILNELANSTGKQILDKYREQEVKYDEDTNHGKKQGARFP